MLIACPVLSVHAFAQSDTVTVTITIKDYLLRPVSEATVYVDDQEIGKTNINGVVTVSNFNAGMHKITASKLGLVTRNVDREFSSGVNFNIQLNRDNEVSDPDAVTFIVLDSGASSNKMAGVNVFVDGKLIGETNTKNGWVQALVEPGEHQVITYKNGWSNNTSVINVEAGSTYTIYMTANKKFSIFDGDLFIYALQKEVFRGLVVTLELSIISMVAGICIGLIMGLGRASPNKIFKGLASVYVEGVRGLPLLLQLLFVNFGLPFLISDLTGGAFNIDGFTACIIALSVNSGAYMGEIFKAGIEAIHKGQMEAARSLGMTYNQSMRFIILPQAFKIVLPALGNEFIALIKDSSIALVISVPEVLWWSKTVGAEAYNTFTPLVAAGLVYLCITIPLGRLVQYIEKKYNVNNVRNQGSGILGKRRKQPPGAGKPEGAV